MTTEYQKLANLLVLKYCKQIGIKNIPRIYTSSKEYNNADKCEGTKIGQRQLKAMSVYALYCNDCNIIYINRRMCTTITKLVDAIVHELVHAKWFNKLEHGRQFENRVKSILNGRRY